MEQLLFTVKAKFREVASTVFLHVLATDWGDARAKAAMIIGEEFAPDALEKVASWEVMPGDSLESFGEQVTEG